MIIRDATASDAEACAEIYGHYVLNSVATFEEEPPSVAETVRRIAHSQEKHAWLVAERDGKVIGFAYGSEFKTRIAYRFTTEVTIYLAPDVVRSGVGRALYSQLLPRLEQLGYRQAISTIAVPHPASVGLHEAMGFTLAGTLENIGWKHNAWRDVAWYQRALGEGATTTP